MTDTTEDREYLLVTVTLDDMLPHLWRTESDPPNAYAEVGNWHGLAIEVAMAFQSMYELTRLEIAVHTEQEVLAQIKFLDDEGSLEIVIQ